jgi:hypothetical protein
MRATHIHILLTIALALFGAASTAAERAVPLPDHGTLTFATPDGWKDDVSQRPNRLPPEIRFSHGTGPTFQLLVTPIWPPLGATDEPSLRALVAQAAKNAEAQSVERSVVVKELSGTSGRGYYFSATDRAPKPSEYKYMTQGMLRAGGVALTFTVLTNDGQAEVVSAALEVLRTARHSDVALATPALAPSEQTLTVTESGDRYRLSVPVSRLEMTIPKGAFSIADVPGRGAAASPRYFQLEDKARGVIVSGWFEPAAGFKGIDAFWKGETEALRRGGFPPTNTKLANVGKWEAVFYDTEIPKGTNTHIRAEWVEQGIWIDVHISVTTREPIDVARATALRVLSSIRVAPVQ